MFALADVLTLAGIGRLLIGGVAGQAPLAILMESYGWQTTMGTAAGAALVLAVLACFIVRDRLHAASVDIGASLLAGLERCLGRVQT